VQAEPVTVGDAKKSVGGPAGSNKAAAKRKPARSVSAIARNLKQ